MAKLLEKIEKAMAPHSSTLAWKVPWTEEPGRLAVHGVAESWTRLSDFTFTFHIHPMEKEMATHSSVLAGESHGRRSLVGYHPRGRKESDMTVRLHSLTQRDTKDFDDLRGYQHG